jgi:hypothetical protein
VFTNEAHRGHDHARTLMRHVMGAATDDGTPTFLLFSDVGTAFYEALGFVALSHVTWTARTQALPTAPARVEPTTDVDRLLHIYEQSWKGPWLRSHRTRARWSRALPQVGDAFLIGDEDYAVVQLVSPNTLWIDDMALATLTPPAAWCALRQLATLLGASRVSGWLRATHTGGPFVATQRTSCIPMVKSPLPLGELRNHFASVDRP